MKKQFFRVLMSVSALSLLTGNALIAADQLVTTTADSGTGSLRDALTAAADGDSVIFENNLSGTILLESSLPLINASISIHGNSNVSIDGQNASQVFFVNSGNVSISNLTVKNGLSQGGNGGSSYSGKGGGGLGAGGGLFVNNPAVVTLTNVNFTSNASKGGNGGSSNTAYYDTGAGGGGGGGFNGGNGGQGGFSLLDGSGGGGGGGFASLGGSGFSGGGGGGGFSGIINGLVLAGNGGAAGTNGGAGGGGFGGTGTGGTAGTGGTTPTNGGNGVAVTGGGGGGGGGATLSASDGGNAGNASAIGGGGAGGGGSHGGTGGNGGDFGGGGGAGGSIGASLFANGGNGGFGGGGAGGGGTSLATTTGGTGGNGGFGAGGGGGGKNANGGLGGTGGGLGGNNDGGGGGGAAFGGAVFVRAGATLNVTGGSFSQNTVTAGAAGGTGGSAGTAGEAAGADFYVSLNSTTTFSTSANIQLDVAGGGTFFKTGTGLVTLAGQSASSALSNTNAEQIKKGTFEVTLQNTTANPSLGIKQGGVHLSQVSVNEVSVHESARLEGTGVVGSASSKGTVAPGGAIGKGIGTVTALTVINNFEQHKKGTLEVAISPNSSNQLIVAGNSNLLGGTLSIVLNPGSYKKGHKYIVLTSTGGLTGKFQTVQVVGHKHLQVKVIYHPKFAEIELLNSVIVL